MKEYEITENDNKVGKIKLFKNNIDSAMFDSLMQSTKGNSYQILKDYKCQTYEIPVIVNDVDELYDIVSIYTKDDIFDIIEEIKKYNNIKTIKKDTLIKIVVPENHLRSFNINKDEIDLESLFLSKIKFIEQVIMNNSNFQKMEYEKNSILNDYNTHLCSSEYEFLVDDERKNRIEQFIKRVDKIIIEVEKNSNYRYGRDYIYPIKILK